MLALEADEAGLPPKPYVAAATRTAVPTSEGLAGMQALKVALHPEQEAQLTKLMAKNRRRCVHI
jgi:hypothetical protein